MRFITSPDHAEGTQALSEKIISLLKEGKSTLWLIPGGSNIPIAAEAMKIIHGAVRSESLKHLTIALTDERYGPVGHADSNWKQLMDTHIDLSGIKAFPILDGSSLTETVARYGDIAQKLLESTDVIVGQFGMGADGHIAGIMPHSPAVSETALPTAGYESKPFTRVTLTFPILRQISFAYMFVSDADKKDAIERLRKDGVSLDDQPAQILKEMGEASVYIS